MSLNFILLTHGRDILIPGTHHEARSFIGVYNQIHNRYKGLYAPAGRNDLARIRGLANVCKLSVTCIAADCGEQVSYTDTSVKYALIKGLEDNKVREELLSQSPELNLDQSLAFIEAKTQGKRSQSSGR